MQFSQNYSFFLFFALTLSLTIFSCENDIDEVNQVSIGNKAELPIESSRDVEFLYSDSAKLQLKLTAPQIDRFASKEKSHFEMPKGLHMLFYSVYPEVQTELKANFGIGYESQNGLERMEVEHKVIVINEKGDKLTSEHLIWDAVKGQIYTNEFVTITTKDEVIWGDGLIANEDFSEYEIKNVKGQINIDDTDFKNEKK